MIRWSLRLVHRPAPVIRRNQETLLDDEQPLSAGDAMSFSVLSAHALGPKPNACTGRLGEHGLAAVEVVVQVYRGAVVPK